MEPSLVIIGVKLKTAPEAVRERFRMDKANHEDALHSLVRSEGIDEAIVLATEARTEFVVWASDPSLAANSVLRFLAREFDLKLCEWSNFYRLVEEDALAHVLRVACGLDSADGEESAITEALAAAWQQGRTAGTSGACLDLAMEKASTLAEQTHGKKEPAAILEKLAQHEAGELRRRLQAGQVVPMVAAFRGRLDEICKQELRKLECEFGPFTEDQQQALSKLAAHITQRISGSLARELKDLPEAPEQDALANVVQRLFRLELEPTGARTITGVADSKLRSPAERERADVH